MSTPVNPFSPGRINGLTLRNRVIKTATFEGMTPGGVPGDALTAHHVALARGGVGMTTVAYCAASAEGRTFGDQMWMSPDTAARLASLVDAVHAEGAAVSLQIGHCGGFSKDRDSPTGPLGPSRALNPYGIVAGLPMTRAMTADDIARTVADFATAAGRAQDAGFDAVEIHLGHGYLLSQWLSPATNRRTDEHGGSVEARLRVPLQVVRAVREAVGPAYPILAKTNLRDGFPGGLELDDAVQIAKALERAGIDAMVMSGGFVSRNAFYLMRGGRPLWHMAAVEKHWLQKIALLALGTVLVRPYPFEEMFFFDDALAVRRAVGIPLVLLGGIVSRANLDRAMNAGFEFVAMGRALIADPDLVNAMRAGTRDATRCNHCNRCVTEMDRVGVRCILDDVAPAQLGTDGASVSP